MADDHYLWPVAKRAGRACLGCRARKVKCDVEDRGLPCTNCVSDEVDCRVQKSRRGRKPIKKASPPKSGRDEAALHSTRTSSERFYHGQTRPASRRTHTTQWLPEPEKRVLAGLFDDESSGRGDRDMYDLLKKADRDTLDRLHNEVTWTSFVGRDPATTLAWNLDKKSSSPTASSPQSPQTISDSLPVFVKPISSHLTPDDIDYLSRKGAFRLPSPAFMEAMIRSYIRYFHPLMPLLDIPTLLCCFSGHGSHCSPRMSILLLQAVLFAGSTFVDLAEIERGGFSTRRAARKTFYDRARVLYDLDVECDRIPVIQTALLLSYWTETPGDSKGGWHWTGICYTLALTLGLHRKSGSELPARHVHLRSRIWWSFYIRDRLIALGTSRPLRVKDGEFNTPMLTLQDFDLDDFTVEGAGDPVFTKQHQTSLAEMCIKMAELCILVGKVIDLHFSLIPSEDQTQQTIDHTGRTTTILWPNLRVAQLDSVTALDRELQTWTKTRPPSTIFQPTMSQQRQQCGIATSVITVHQAFLHFYLASAMSALYRPLINRRSILADEVSSEHLNMASERVEQAAVESAAANRELCNLNLARFLHPTAATMDLPIIITHVKRLRHRNRHVVTQALESILYCLKVLQTMQDLYPGVDLAIGFALAVVKRAGIELQTEGDQGLVGLRYGGYSCSIASENLDRSMEQRVSDAERDSPSPVFLGMPATTEHDIVDSGPQERQPASTLSDLPEAQWDFQNDIFLTDAMDFDPAFGLMCDFETLNYREIGRLSHT